MHLHLSPMLKPIEYAAHGRVHRTNAHVPQTVSGTTTAHWIDALRVTSIEQVGLMACSASTLCLLSPTSPTVSPSDVVHQETGLTEVDRNRRAG